MVPQQDDPDPETVEKYHKLYMHELSKLFNEHKVKFGVSADKTIEFVWMGIVIGCISDADIML